MPAITRGREGGGAVSAAEAGEITKSASARAQRSSVPSSDMRMSLLT
jgi:hypothetical protein